MLSKTLNILKNNPILILSYFAYIVIVLIVTSGALPNYFTEDPVKILISTIIFTAFILLLCVVGFLFTTGYGSMVSEAVKTGKTSLSSLFPGIKKYFVRILVATLLMFVAYMAVSIIFSLI